MTRTLSWRLVSTSVLALLTLPALAETSKQEQPAVEFKDVYQAGTASAPAASATTQAQITPQTSAPVAPARTLPASSSAAAVESSNHDEQSTRQGFHLRLTYGPGFATFRGQGPNGSASISGLSSNTSIAIGGSLMRGLVLAGTLQSTQTTARFKGGPFADATLTSNGATFHASDRASAAFTRFGALIDWYPKLHCGFHSGLTAGLASVSVVNLADNSTLTGAKLGGSIFVGYDWSIARYWAIGLELLGSGTTQASLKTGRSRVDSGYELAPISLGLSASLVYF